MLELVRKRATARIRGRHPHRRRTHCRSVAKARNYCRCFVTFVRLLGLTDGAIKMAKTAGDVIVETLMQWGVDTVFGIPGDGVDGVIEAFRKKMDKIKFIQVRHEEAAAFMACGYAKFTGRLGVCVATSGPGGIHLLNGL